MKTLLLLDTHVRKRFEEAEESDLISFLRNYPRGCTYVTHADRVRRFYRWVINRSRGGGSSVRPSSRISGSTSPGLSHG